MKVSFFSWILVPIVPIIFVGIAGCLPPRDNLQQAILDGSIALANTGVPVESAATQFDNAIIAAYKANGAEFVSEALLDSLRVNAQSPQSASNLIKRSSEIAPRLIELENDNKATPKNVVLFVNGINTDYHGYHESLLALDSLLNPLHQSRDFNVAGLYNPTGGLWWDLPAETVLQKIFDFLDLYEHDAKDAFSDQYRQHMIYLLNKYENVVIVAHSQGNFYTQEAIASLPIGDRKYVSVVQVGSPASGWPAGMRYNVRIDALGDPVSCLAGSDVISYNYQSEPSEGIWSEFWDVFSWGLEAAVELTVGTSCHIGQGVYAFVDKISLSEFMRFHGFQNYAKSEYGVILYNHVDEFCADGQPLNQINITGMWTNTDTTPPDGRTFEEYHATVTLNEDGTADYYECQFDSCAAGTGTWEFNFNTFEFVFRSDGGAVFNGTVSGDSAAFEVHGFWSNGGDGTVLWVRGGKQTNRPAELPVTKERGSSSNILGPVN